MSRSYQSNWESIGNTSEPDILYYNASIVNNNTDDLVNGFAFQDPLIKFNETRDHSIVGDASKYQFSIVRFVVNGGNLDLPLFIPSIQSGTGQYDPNLTEYGLGISLRLSLTNVDETVTAYAVAPPITYVMYVPENFNPQLAPVPQAPSSPNFVYNVNYGIWDSTYTYSQKDIVTISDAYTVFYQAQISVPVGTPLNGTYTVTTPSGTSILPYWRQVGPELGRQQDVSSRYYWVSTFQHMVDLVNTALDTANQATFEALLAAWIAHGAGNDATNFPYATAGVPDYLSYAAQFPAPRMSYNSANGLFSIVYPNAYLNLGGDTQPKIGLWFNANTYGLFANFPSEYYNTSLGDRSLSGLGATSGPFTVGYSYRMNVQYLNNGANVSPPPTVNAVYPAYPEGYSLNLITMTQEYISTSTLWCPVDSLVFVSNLLPLQNEQTAPPNAYGQGNVGNSTAVAQSAFQPIITDVAQNLSSDPAGWRKMLYYSPTAEYRMADFQNSKAEIKNIDVQVFWKNRLNNQLYPLSMYNLSSVSIKIMFRKKNASYSMIKNN